SAMALAAVGRPVAIWDLNADNCREVAAELAAQYSVATFGFGVDLRDAAAIAPAVTATRAALPPLGGLVHAAGVVMETGLEGLTADNWDAVIAVNLRALPLLVQALLPDLRANAGSAVVGIASINATL